MQGCTIIICTYNRLPYLKRCLAALEKITYHPLEIIIVNDGSIDGTREFLDSLSIAQVSIIHNEKNSGLSSSRNRGIKHARYDVVAFTDDDCEPDSEWILHLMQGFDEKNVGLVIGQTFYIAQDYQGYFPERLVQNKLARWPMGCNCAYRKKVFDTIGYFEDEYFFYNNEDSEMAIRAVSQGWHYRRILEAIVYHQAMDWTAASLLRSARNGAIWPLLKKKYPRYYQEFKPPVFKGVVVSPQEYLYLVFLPIMVPLLLIRYLMHGKRDLKIFFIKWPVWLILRRWYVYYTAVKNRVFML